MRSLLAAFTTLLVLSGLDVASQASAAILTVPGARSPTRILLASEKAFASSSSVQITGYFDSGGTTEQLEFSLFSDGDGDFNFTIGPATLQILILSAGSAYYLADAAYLQNYTNYSPTDQASYANTWLKYGSLDAADLVREWSFSAILNAISHLQDGLTSMPNRKVDGISVLGVHSGKSGDLFVARTSAPYPIEYEYRHGQVREQLSFSGWSSQTEPVAPTSFLIPGGNSSTTWSGYVLLATPGTLTEVSGGWTVPSANCSSGARTQSSAWVGIDGQVDKRVFQTGTETDCLNGSQVDYAWFENYPSPVKVLAMKVNPGDAMSATVQQVSVGSWTYELEDRTTGQSVGPRKPIAYKGPGSSAEWIEEDPGGADLPLTNFGTMSFSGVEVDGSPASLDDGDNGLNMVQSGQSVSKASQFANDGFTLTFS